MAFFYFDEDMATLLVPLVRERGHGATDTDAEGRKGSPDTHQLLFAAQSGWVIVTHNRSDYRLLHDAWLLWSRSWGVAPEHSGILVIEQPVQPARAAELLHAFVHDPDVRLINRLHSWTQRRGWQRFPR